MVGNGMKAPPQKKNPVTPAGGDRGGRVGVGERERVAGQETSSADEVIGLKIKRWRHLKPIPVNELSGARGGKEETGEGRAGGGGAGGRAGPRLARPLARPPLGARPREPAAREAAGGGRGSRSRPTRRLAGRVSGLLRPPAPARARLGAPGSRPWSAGPSSARPPVGAPLSPGRGGSPKPPTLVKREHGDLRLGRSLCKKVLEPAVQGSSPGREVTGT